jgi:two-component system, cell cycle response regulator
MGLQGHDDRSTPERRGTPPARRTPEPEPLERQGEDATVITNLDELAAKRPVENPLHPYLIIIAGNGVGKNFRLDRPVMYIGRGETCDVQIQDSGISRKHARIVVEGDGAVFLEDLGSTNGTFVEHGRVDRHRLQDGDKIQFGRTTIIKFSVTDSTEIEFTEHMYVSATHDGLTRINNRKFFEEQFRTEFAYSSRHRLPLTLLMIDLDHFKRVNDTYGHATGDLVLKMVARTLARVIRTEDILARYGGEEFVVLARGTDRKSAVVLAERIRSTVESQLIPNPAGAFRITVSLGTATLADANLTTRAALVAAADKALYRAKNAGRNRIEQYEDGEPLDVSKESLTEDTTA